MTLGLIGQNQVVGLAVWTKGLNRMLGSKQFVIQEQSSGTPGRARAMQFSRGYSRNQVSANLLRCFVPSIEAGAPSKVQSDAELNSSGRGRTSLSGDPRRLRSCSNPRDFQRLRRGFPRCSASTASMSPAFYYCPGCWSERANLGYYHSIGRSAMICGCKARRTCLRVWRKAMNLGAFQSFDEETHRFDFLPDVSSSGKDSSISGVTGC
jgi:hypothetical protein